MQTKFKKGDRVVAQDIDISNIESKPIVVVVSNQSEYDQLMQHLEKEGCACNGRNKEKPTEWRPKGFLPPYIINIQPDKNITWGLESKEPMIPFPEYAAKHIQPTGNSGKIKRKSFKKGDRAQITEADTAWNGRTGTILRELPDKHGWFEFSIDGGSVFDVHESILQRTSPKRPYPNRVVKSKYDAVVAELDKYKESAEINGKAAHDMLRDYERILLDIGRVTVERRNLQEKNDSAIGELVVCKSKLDFAITERDRLQEELELHKQSSMRKSLEVGRLKELTDTLSQEIDYAHNANNTEWAKVDEFKALYLQAEERALKGAEKLAHLDTLARKLRDQRDTARFIAALFGLAALGLAVAVLLGRLVPVG